MSYSTHDAPHWNVALMSPELRIQIRATSECVLHWWTLVGSNVHAYHEDRITTLHMIVNRQLMDDKVTFVALCEEFRRRREL